MNNNLSTGRRNFLKVFGAGLTASVLSPLASQGEKLQIGKRKARIGLLLPNSNEHPAYPKSFLKGLKMGLNRHNSVKKGKIEVISESVNFGAPLITKEKTTKLLNENDIDVLVGLLNSEVCTHISSMVQNSKTPLVVANAGENHPVSEIQKNPYIFLNHLGLYQANYRLGQLLVKNKGKKGMVVTSFYDSGYDALFSFRQGVASVGGEVLETFVEQANDEGFIQKATDAINAQNPDFVFVLMNGKPAFDFLNYCGMSGVKAPLAVSNFILDENRIHELGNVGSTISSVASWAGALASDSNRAFSREFEKENRIKPDGFALLGYETGLQVYAALAKMSPDFTGEEFISALASVQIDSPRGELSFEKETGIVKAPLYEMECYKMPGTYELKNNITGTIAPVETAHADFAVLDTDLRSGWFNPYLFV